MEKLVRDCRPWSRPPLYNVNFGVNEGYHPINDLSQGRAQNDGEPGDFLDKSRQLHSTPGTLCDSMKETALINESIRQSLPAVRWTALRRQQKPADAYV